MWDREEASEALGRVGRGTVRVVVGLSPDDPAARGAPGLTWLRLSSSPSVDDLLDQCRATLGASRRGRRDLRALLVGCEATEGPSTLVVSGGDAPPDLAPRRLAALVAAAEILAACGRGVAVAWERLPPVTPHVARILHRPILCGAAPPASPPPLRPADAPVPAVGAAWLDLVPGRPHPASRVEATMARLLAADEELRPIVTINAPVDLGWGAVIHVDALCGVAGLAIEFDGPEHAEPSRYALDRRRDADLLLAGVATLRITNDEVTSDPFRVLETIRLAVRRKVPG